MRDFTGEIRLSILIPTIPARKNKFGKLFNEVKRQIKYCYDTHPILGFAQINFNNGASFRNGGLNIGAKRQLILDLSEGTYVCYLDDDEYISPDYVETLLRLCYEDKDVCTFRSISHLSNNWALVDMKLGNPMEQINPEKITLRPPWHVCPVKREYAVLYKFENSNYGEDWDWFEQVLTHCKDEAHTDKIIHNYRHGAHSEADKI